MDKKIYDAIKASDYISGYLELKVYGSSRYKTHFAGCLSISIVLMVFALSVSLLVEVFSKSVPMTTMSSAFNDTVLINFTQDFPLMANFILRGGKLLENADSYFTLNMINFNYTYDYSNNTKTLISTKIPIPIPKCDNLTWNDTFGAHESLFEKELISSQLNRSYCKSNKNNDSFAFNAYGSYPLAFLDLYLNFCDNSTSKIPCKPMDVIISQLKNFFVIFSYPDFFFDQQFQDPGIFYVTSEALPVSSIVYKRYYFNYKNVIYNTDTGLVFEDISSKTYYQKQSESKDINTELTGIYPNTFAEITITAMTKVYDIYNRSYKKVPQLLAEVGGVINALVIIATILNYYVEKKLKEIGILELCINQEFIDKTKNNPNQIKKIKISKNINKKSKKLYLERFQLQSYNYIESQEAMIKEKLKKEKPGAISKPLKASKCKTVNNNNKLRSIIFDHEMLLDNIFHTEVNFFTAIFPCLRSESQIDKITLAEKFYDQVFDFHFLLGNVLEVQIDKMVKEKRKKLLHKN